MFNVDVYSVTAMYAAQCPMSNENISWTGFAGKAVIAEIHRQSKAQRTADEKLKLKGEKTRIKMELRYLARSCRANWFGEINLATYTL